MSASDKDLIERTRKAAALKSARRLAREAGIGPTTARRIKSAEAKRLNTDTREALTAWLDKQQLKEAAAGALVVRERGAPYGNTARERLLELLERNGALRTVLAQVSVQRLLKLTYNVALDNWDENEIEQLDAIRDQVRKLAGAIPITAEDDLREAERRLEIAFRGPQAEGDVSPPRDESDPGTQSARGHQGG